MCVYFCQVWLCLSSFLYQTGGSCQRAKVFISSRVSEQKASGVAQPGHQLGATCLIFVLGFLAEINEKPVSFGVKLSQNTLNHSSQSFVGGGLGPWQKGRQRPASHRKSCVPSLGIQALS